MFAEKTGTQTECAEFCSEKGGSLPMVLNLVENAQLAWQMVHYDVKMTWIGKCAFEICQLKTQTVIRL